MPASDTALAENLCTRLCHDLTGPIGAINNGTEFLAEEDGEMMEDAIALISSSAHEAVARLKFFRLAYGMLKERGEANLQDYKDITQEFFESSRITLDWPDQHTAAAGISISQKMARLLLNLIVLASRTLIKGGQLSIRIEQDETQRTLSITASGEMIKPDEAAEAVLQASEEAPELSPKTVQAYLTLGLVREMNVSLSLETTGTTYQVTALRSTTGV